MRWYEYRILYYGKKKEKMRPDFEAALKKYGGRRFTLNYVPSWAIGGPLDKPRNGKPAYHAPLYDNDKQWYDRTIFPGETSVMIGDKVYTKPPSWPTGEIFSVEPTWPLGYKTIPYPFRLERTKQKTKAPVQQEPNHNVTEPEQSGSEPVGSVELGQIEPEQTEDNPVNTDISEDAQTVQTNGHGDTNHEPH